MNVGSAAISSSESSQTSAFGKMFMYLIGGLSTVVGYTVLKPGFNLRESRLLVAGLFLLGYVITYVCNSIVQNVYHARRARQLGCQPAFRKRHKLPGGIDWMYRVFQADQRGQVPEYIEQMADGIGPDTFQQALFSDLVYVTRDPKNIQAVLATQFQDFELGEQRRGNFFPMLGNGIFTADGKVWEHSRALLRPQFTRDQVGDIDLEEAHLQQMLKHMPTQNDGWTAEVDLQPMFFRLTMDSATEFLFGESVHSQLEALGSMEAVKQIEDAHGRLNIQAAAKSFDRGTHALGKRARFGEHYWLYSPKSFVHDCKQVHRLADYFVDLALRQDQKPSASSLEKGSQSKYVFLNELSKATRDRDELRSQLLNILLAGRDTTAGLLGWTFWLLARHPAAFQKLRQAVLNDFGTFDEPRNFGFASLKACTYLQHTMNEVLRLYPSVPLNSRRATRDTTLPRGGGPDGSAPIYVRKGTEINYSVYIMQRRKDLWGPDAREFRPERWLGRKVTWEWLPFNAGPRICLGQQFALTEAGYVIARLVQRYDKIENVDPDPEIRHQYSVTDAPKRVMLRLHEA